MSETEFKFGVKISNLDELVQGELYLVQPRNMPGNSLQDLVGMYNGSDNSTGVISFYTMYVKIRVIYLNPSQAWEIKHMEEKKYPIYGLNNSYDIYSLHGTETKIKDKYVEGEVITDADLISPPLYKEELLTKQRVPTLANLAQQSLSTKDQQIAMEHSLGSYKPHVPANHFLAGKSKRKNKKTRKSNKNKKRRKSNKNYKK